MGIWDDLTGKSASDASNKAAADTYGKQRTAISDLNSYGDTLPGQYSGLAKGYDPYRSAGTDALSMLRSGLGLGGNGQDFTNAYHNLPGYQSGLDTGLTAARRGLNAGNMSQSGGALKALDRYGADYEDQKSGDYLTRLMGLSGQGLQATGAATGLEAQGLGQQANLRQSAFGGDMTSAGTIGQGMVAGAQARQAGTQGILSAGTNLLGSLAGAGAFGGLGIPGSTRLSFPTAGQQGNGGTYWPAPRA